jgi:methylenetetrahydrofolate dehydrogenase (NADP+)/methenyltetrahydrofolate cyclohydrolase
MNNINGKLLADKIKDAVAEEVFDLCANPASPELCHRRPGLAIIIVGSRPDSELYVSLKEKNAKTVGIDTSLYKFSENDSEAEILDAIKFLNTDDTIDGILVQLPLPDNFNTDKIIDSINPDKDVDGFHQENLKKLETSDVVVSPVFQSILACLADIKFDLKDKTVAIVAKPGIFTQSLDKLFENLGAKVLSLEPKDVGTKTAEADLLISAVGQADLINHDDIKQDAVLIDIGISQNEAGKTCGDINAESVASKAGWLTPVPGGIGPMTIAFALRNTLTFFKEKNSK